MSWKRSFWIWGLIVIHSAVAFAQDESCWRNLTVRRDGSMWVRIDYRTFWAIRFAGTKDLWVNVQADQLGPTDIVDATISKRELGESTTEPVERLELLYNPRNGEFTRSSDTPFSVRAEGRTGGDFTPKYYLTLTVTRPDGTRFNILEETEVDF